MLTSPSSRAWTLTLVLLVVACEPAARMGASCARSSECSAPLVCAVGRCRTECREAIDCPIGATCVLDTERRGACQLPDDPRCPATPCGDGFACFEGLCTNGCTSAAECATGNVCLPTELGISACASPRALDGGMLDAGMLDAGTLDAGTEMVDGGDGTTLTMYIERDIDDGEISSLGLSTSGEMLTDFIGSESAGLTRAYFAFHLPAAIPPGTTVRDARLRLYGADFWTLSCMPFYEMGVVAADAADAALPSSNTDFPGGPTGPASTAAVVIWGPSEVFRVGEWNASPDLSPILQELVDEHGGLAAGATIVLWAAAANFVADCEWGAEDYARITSNHSQLDVSF